MKARIWWTVVGAALTVAFLVAIHYHRRSSPALPPSMPQPVFEQPVFEPPEVPARVSERPPATAPAPLAAGNVIDNPNCRFFAGARDANDLAVVVVPDDDGDGARFSVVDAGGRVFDGGLPFIPARASLGKRRDGAVLVAFGGPGEDRRRPVQVFHDGDLVYEREFAWDFDVATDGSSYYAIEGSPYGEFSKLILRNLELGIETQVDMSDKTRLLGGFFGRYRPHLLSVSYYSHDNTEVVMSPLSSWGFPTLGHHSFVPVDGGEPRTIAVQEKDVVFASSRLGYFHLDDGASPRIVQRRFDWASPDRSAAVDVWATELAAGTPVTLGLSDDGAWLIVSALPFAILDAATGTTVFEFPTAAELARAVHEVSGVEVAMSGQDLLRALAHMEDSPAALSGDIAEGAALLETAFDNGLLESLLTIRAANVLQAGESVGSFHDAAFRDGKFEVTLGIENGPRTVVVFDMRDIKVDAQPAFRVDIDPKNPCASGDTWHAGLQVHDGELTYLTTKRAPPTIRETLP